MNRTVKFKALLRFSIKNNPFGILDYFFRLFILSLIEIVLFRGKNLTGGYGRK